MPKICCPDTHTINTVSPQLLFCKNIPWVPKCEEIMILKNVHGIFKGKENKKLKQEPFSLIAPCLELTFWPQKKLPKVFKHCSKSLIWPLGSHSWSLFAQIHTCMKCLPKVKSGQIGVDSNITQNHTSSIYSVIYGHYLPQFT